MFAKLLSFVREVVSGAHVSTAKVDTGGGDTQQATHAAGPGDDSHPLTTDVPVLVRATGRGATAAVGYIDVENEPQAAEGEKRFYSRDSNGNVAMVVWLKADNTVELGSPDDFVALASATDARLDAIRDAIDAFVQATPVSQDGGAALQTAVKTAWGSGPTPDADVGSGSVKVQS